MLCCGNVHAAFMYPQSFSIVMFLSLVFNSGWFVHGKRFLIQRGDGARRICFIFQSVSVCSFTPAVISSLGNLQFFCFFVIVVGGRGL